MQTKLMRSAIGLASIFAAVTAFGQITWAPNYKAALNQAKATNKLVMVEFFATWDRWGMQLDSETLSKQPVIALTKKFVPVRINVEKEGAELGKKYKITNYPTILFIDKDGRDVGKIDGFEADTEFIKHVNVFLKDFANEPALRAKYKSKPKNLDAIVGLGIIEANRYHPEVATKFLREAEALDAKNSTGKLSDLYSAIGDHFQNAAKFESAIAHFKKAGDTSKLTDKKSYAYLSIAACYMSMALDPQFAVNTDREKLIGYLRAALPYVEDTLKLPNLKAEDKKIAEDDRQLIRTALRGT